MTIRKAVLKSQAVLLEKKKANYYLQNVTHIIHNILKTLINHHQLHYDNGMYNIIGIIVVRVRDLCRTKAY